MTHLTEQFEHLKIQLEAIKYATNNFADDNCIGRGGFGKVYKGELLHSEGRIIVAIKRLDPIFGQGNPEFWKEIVILSRYKHENIISLLGFCDESNEKILVYEYAPRKSLDLYLNNVDLSWIQRLKICIGVARGLAYLHNPGVSQQRVLHRDIKSSNILLDENSNAKISDLGLSKFGPANQQYTFLVSHTVGTHGYCDPLYMETGLLTKESDVYSFGVVLFEVLCGRLCIDNKNGMEESLTSLVRHYYPQNKISEIIYGNIRDGMNPESLWSFITIAYQCLKRDLKERPLMSEVVSMLESALEYQAQNSSFTQMGNDVPEIVENLPSPVYIKVHQLMCTELMKPVESVLEIFEEIEATRSRIATCDSGINSLVQLNNALGKAKILIQNCSQSSKLYLALTGNTILSRCKKAIKLLEQSLSQLQNMVPAMLASKISPIITELGRVKISLDPSEEEAGKTVKAILEGYKTGSSSQNENVNECIRIVAIMLQITSQKAILIEKRSIKKLLTELGEGGDQQINKHILRILLDVLKNHGNLMTSGYVENNSVVKIQDYRSRRVEYSVDRDGAPKGILCIPPEEFKCPISCKVMYDPVVIDTGETFERMWIQKWFDEGHDICPKTRKKLSNFELTPNTTMKGKILEWCETQDVTISDPCVDFSTDWKNSSFTYTSLSSKYSLQLPVIDYSKLSVSSLESTCELDMESSQELDDTLPWEFQCKFVEDLMTRLVDDDRAFKFMSCENLFESIIRFLKVARIINHVKAQRSGCLLLLALATKCRIIKILSKDAYELISEFLESEMKEEALAIIENLSFHENHRSKIASSVALTHIFKILDTQNIQFQTPALKILYNLTLNRNFRSLLSSKLIPKLVALSENESLSRYCIAILTNLCGNEDNKNIIAETEGCIAFVASVLESESCEEQEQALEILLSLCSQSIEYCRLVMNEGVIPAVVVISVNGNDKGKAKAHEMLQLLRDPEIHQGEYVEESPAPVYDVLKESNNFQLVEKKTSSTTSRFFSKFSLTQKRKV